MGRPRSGDAPKYLITWDSENRKIKIRPKLTRDTVVAIGLGNAVIKFSVKNPPKKVATSITGDSTAQGLVPPSPYTMGRWVAAIANVEKRQISLTMTDGSKRVLEYPFASSAKAYELNKDVTIRKNHIGQAYTKHPIRRINW